MSKSLLHFEDFSNRALFIHIPKTGGASMSKAPFILKQATPDRPPDSEFLQSLPLRFSFVRNPYDRVASAILNLGWATPETFEDFVLNELPKLHKQGLHKAKEQQLWLMTRYLVFDGKICVDVVGRFENIEDDWNKICRLMAYDFPLPHENKGEYEGYDKFYTPETRAVIGVAYADDFVNFKYKHIDK